jgi:hypothetical protein
VALCILAFSSAAICWVASRRILFISSAYLKISWFFRSREVALRVLYDVYIEIVCRVCSSSSDALHLVNLFFVDCKTIVFSTRLQI